MKCLLCDEEMKATVVSGVEIDLCTKCGGVWLDEGELGALTGHNLEAYRELPCPKCGKAMSIRTIGHVEVDYCAHCGGTWLDEGELDAIRHVPPGKGLEVGRFEQFLKNLTQRRNLEIAKDAKTLEGEDDSLLLIDNVFLMHKNGLLITSVTHHLSPDVDEDILAGMLVAIQDFVEVSFNSLGDSTLQGIVFGEKQILLERGDRLMTAMVVSGDLPPYFRKKFKALLRAIEERYGSQLDTWKGNLNELEGVEHIIQEIFGLKERETEEGVAEEKKGNDARGTDENDG
ncbi:MAG: zf-TFIIB domain-containing protein [Thermoplasmata archaeon]|nr:zf-TFIIB domain-containing protein [Thermoplasmata archaeon]